MNPSTAAWTIPALGGIECFRATALRQRYARHRHEGFAIGVFEDGVGGTEYRGALACIAPGQIVAMNPDEAHTGFAADGGAITYRMFYVTEAAVTKFASVRRAGFRHVCIPSAHWAGRLRSLHKQLEHGTERLASDVQALEVLADFFSTFGATGAAPPAGRETKAIARAKEYLRSHYASNVNVQEVAAAVGLSPAYLIRAFRRSVGMPPYTWLLQLRIDHARELLAQGREIAGVALEVGFADQSHLTRRFRSVTGLTPGQYAAGHYRSRRRT